MRKTLLLALCLLLAPWPAAGATTSDLDVRWPYVDRLNPEFTLGGDVLVRFSYGAKCADACGAAEWRLVVDMPWMGDLVPDASMPPGVAGGFVEHAPTGWFETVFREVEFSAAGLDPGYHSIRVAARPAGADAWRVAWGAWLEVLDAHDADGDGIPIALERRICEGEASSIGMLVARDACLNAYDLDLRGRAATLEVPRIVGRMHDSWMDLDGYEHAVTLQMTRVNLVPGLAPADMVQPGLEQTVVLDPVEDRRARALHLCARIPGVTGFAWSADADGDGWPERGAFALGKVCDDARAENEPRLVPTTDVFEARIDYDDEDAEVAQEAPFEAFYHGVHAAFGPDADADGIPSTSTVTYASVTFDPSLDVPMVASYEAFEVGLDLDDEDRDLPVLFSPLELDGDGVPEHAEPWLCAWDDPFTPEDGTCGTDARYTPPEVFTSRFEAPLLLGDDDVDILPDGAEAATCDAGARADAGLPCDGDDLVVL